MWLEEISSGLNWIEPRDWNGHLFTTHYEVTQLPKQGSTVYAYVCQDSTAVFLDFEQELSLDPASGTISIHRRPLLELA